MARQHRRPGARRLRILTGLYALPLTGLPAVQDSVIGGSGGDPAAGDPRSAREQMEAFASSLFGTFPDAVTVARRIDRLSQLIDVPRGFRTVSHPHGRAYSFALSGSQSLRVSVRCQDLRQLELQSTGCVIFEMTLAPLQSFSTLEAAEETFLSMHYTLEGGKVTGLGAFTVTTLHDTPGLLDSLQRAQDPLVIGGSFLWDGLRSTWRPYLLEVHRAADGGPGLRTRRGGDGWNEVRAHGLSEEDAVELEDILDAVSARITLATTPPSTSK